MGIQEELEKYNIVLNLLKKIN